MAFKSFFSRVKSSFKLRRSKNPSNIPENPIQLSPSPLFVDCQPATPLPFEKPRRSSFKHRFSSFLGCGFRTHEDDLPESPPCKWDETPRRDYNSSISSDDELFRPPPPPTQHAITTSISGDSDEELFPPPPPPPPTPTRHSIITALTDSGLCGYESDDEEEEEMVTLSLNRKKRTKKLQPSFPAERSKMEGGRSVSERCDKLLAEMRSGTELQPSTVSVLDSSFYKDESPPCKWDKTPRRDYNSSISSDDELFRPPPPPTQHAITTSISGDSDEELFPPPPPTPTRHSIITALADSGLCGYESDDEEEEEMVTLSLNRKKRTKKLQPSFPAERSKMEGGRSVLERCDKLLAEMRSGTELQPSTVSVLDSSFYKDESTSPLPVMKRSIGFKDELGEFDEDIWDDCDFIYISEILRASNYLPEGYDIFQFLEEQQYLKGNDTSGVSSLQRKLIFDTVSEILNKDREMPPWKVLSQPNSSIGKPSLHQIWSEFQRIRERDTAENLFDSVCGVPRKELAGGAITGRGDCPVEMSEVTLDIERMIFKDLIDETIGDLVAFARNRKSSARAL